MRTRPSVRLSAAVGGVVVAAVLLAAVAPVPVSGQAESGTVVGRPQIALSAQDAELQVGERNTLAVLVANDGDVDRGGPAEFVDRVTTARNVRLSVAEDRLDEDLARAIDVRTGTVLVGSVGQGVSGPHEIELDVSESLRPGTYEIPVEVTYDYTSFVEYGPATNPVFGDTTRREVVPLEVTVENRPRFSIESTAGAVPAGETGTLSLSVTNVGGRTATSARVRLSAADSPLFFGEREEPQESTTVLVPELGGGDERTVEVPVGTARDTRPGTYPLTATVAYEDERGLARESRPREVGVRVGPRQSFGLSTGDASLQVGSEGTVRGVVTNTGERAVSDAVLVLEDVPAGLESRTAEVPLGTLGPGANASFAYTLSASNRTTAGDRQLGFRVRYRDATGERRTSDPLDATVALAREQTFALTNLSGRLRVGWTGNLSGTVVNTGERPVSNATVVLSTGAAGLAPRASEFVVGDLAPGEPAPFEFTVDVSNRTAAGPRPVGIRVRYRDASGDVRTGDRLDGRVTVAPEQSFAVRDTSNSLRVGQRGTVRGVVTNTGGATVTDAVVVAEPSGDGLVVRDPEFAVGDLAPEASAPFTFTVDVSNRTAAGPRQFGYRVRYRDASGDIRTSDRLTASVRVGAAPAFAVRNLTGALRVGQPGTVSGTLVNTGEVAVEDAVLSFAPDGTTLRPRTSERALGTLAPGARANFSYTVDVANGTRPGSLPAAFRVRYTDAGNATQRADPIRRTLRVSREQTFALTDVRSDLRVGQRGTVSGTLVNTGPGAVTDATVSLVPGGDLRPTTTAVSVGDLASGESAPVSFTVGVPNGTSAVPRSFPVRVRYRGAVGEAVVSDRIDASVGVAGEQTFDVRNLTSSLRVDWTGTVAGEVVNTGDRPVSNAVVRLAPGEGLRPRVGEYAVDDLAPGEPAAFEFTVDAANRTAPGPRSLPFRVSYRAGGETYRSDAIERVVRVDPEREPFRVEPVNASVPVDGDAVLVVRVTNALAEPLTDVRGRLTVAPPFETEDTSAFAGRLEPGESTRLRFDLSTSNEAIPKTDSVSLSVDYRDARGERRVTDPALVGVRIVERTGAVPVVPAALALLAGVAAAIWWWRRR